jgi:TatD DNase family protein
MMYTDSHAHLPDVAERLGRTALGALLADYGEAWREAGGGPEAPRLVDIGTEPGDFPGRRAFLGDAPFLRYSLGIWPGEVALADCEGSLGRLDEALDTAGQAAAAIGECGLDYHHMEGPREAQRGLFEGQIERARRRGLPLIVHSRDAFDDTCAILAAEARGLLVILHCFGYGPAEAKAFLDLDCWISFAGNLTYRGAEALREAVAFVPLDRLLLETDSPYMNPEPRRGRPCSPRDVARTYELAARVRGEDLDGLAHAVSRNVSSLFG